MNPSSEFTRALQQGGATAAQAARLRAQAGALFLRADGASAAQIVQIEKEAATLEAQFNQLLKIKKVAPAKRPTD